MKNFKRFLREEVKPKFVLIIGGAGSGKNYYIEHNAKLKTYTLVDVDVLKRDLDLTSAIAEVKPRLEAAFKQGENVVHPSTGSNLKGQQTKIALARKYEYEVILLLKETPVEQALKNVQARVSAGGHSVAEKDIISSNEKARANYQALKPSADSTEIV